MVIQVYKTSHLKSKLEKYHGDKTDSMFWAWALTWTKATFKSWNIESFLPHLNCPVLIIQGENDEYGSLKQVQHIVKGVKGYSEQLIIANAKHTPHKEVPELTLNSTCRFITKQLL